MRDARPHNFDPATDLVLERVVDVPVRLVWLAWSRPEHLVHWWAPKPLKTEIKRMEFRPLGVFDTVMRGPDGAEYPGIGVYLDIVEQQRIIFTDTLDEDLRPAKAPFFTAIVSFEDLGDTTRYVARALHRNAEDRATHEKMGFHEDWGTCLDQLVAYAKGLAAD